MDKASAAGIPNEDQHGVTPEEAQQYEQQIIEVDANFEETKNYGDEAAYESDEE